MLVSVYIWNPATYTSSNRKYLAIFIDHSVITCDKTANAVRSETLLTRAK